MPLLHRRSGTGYRRDTTGTKQPHTRDVVLASATLVNRKQIRRTTRKQSWQEEAWAFFDTLGELHSANRWIGNALSRVRLFIAEASQDGGGEPSPTDNPPANATDALEELFSGAVGQGEMLRRLATNLDVVGEVFLIRLPKKFDPSADHGSPQYRWLVASIDEFSYSGGQSRMKLPEDGTNIILDPEEVTIIRLWAPHPRVAWESDSSVRSNLPVLREVQSLSQHITATVESRLAGAGVLAIPKSATLPNPNIQEGANPLHHNAFVDALVQGMVTPITDRDNASAVVPIVISVDDEAIGKIEHLSFWSELSSQVTEMREAALRRFAQGTDLPTELVHGGLGQSSHWNAAEIEEMAVKTSIEPIAGTICDALTQQFLWPALRAMGEEEPERYVIWYDAQELTQRPDRSAEAQELYDKGVLSPEALLRENGFNTDDRPNEDERRKEFARQVVIAKPELISALAPYVGFEGMEERFEDIMQPAPAPAGPVAPPGSDTEAIAQQAHNVHATIPQQRPTAEDTDNKPAPVAAAATPVPTGESDAQWQMAAIELVALRALELAGKRLLTNGSRGLRGKPQAQSVHSWDLHTVIPEPPTNVDRLLHKAFDLSTPVLGEQPCIQAAIETYCRALIASGRPHRREYLVQALEHAGCLPPTA